jgi:hypothetical protein
MTASWAIFPFLAAGVMNLEQPLQLVTQVNAAGLQIRVEGDSPIDCELQYELQVESGSQGNRNRTVQRGKERLSAGRKRVVARTTVGNISQGQWTARLIVQSCRGERYEILRSGTG